MNSTKTLILLLASNTFSFLVAAYLGYIEGKRHSRKQVTWIEED
jgi:hypothetical protein